MRTQNSWCAIDRLGRPRCLASMQCTGCFIPVDCSACEVMWSRRSKRAAPQSAARPCPANKQEVGYLVPSLKITCLQELCVAGPACYTRPNSAPAQHGTRLRTWLACQCRSLDTRLALASIQQLAQRRCHNRCHKEAAVQSPLLYRYTVHIRPAGGPYACSLSHITQLTHHGA